MTNLLLIENDPMIADTLLSYLSTVSADLSCAVRKSPPEACAYLAKHSVDLIISELFPHYSNPQYLNRYCIRNVPDILIISDCGDAATICTLLKYGILDYLKKPFHYERFCATVQCFLNRITAVASKAELNQQQIDALIHPAPLNSSPLTKGISKSTLQRVSSYLTLHRDARITLANLEEALSVSRVTAKRYLDYLVATGCLQLVPNYTTGGRPASEYILLRAPTYK